MKIVRSWKVIAASLLALTVASAASGQEKKPEHHLPAGVKGIYNLEYVKGGHERNRLDLYLPEDVSGKLPLVVWIHGGGWQAGSKEGCPALWLVKRGYVVASINYRYSQQAVFPAQIEDCKAAIRWLRANAGRYSIDPAHVGVWGASAGGHLVAMLGTTAGAKEFDDYGDHKDQSSRVQCVVDFFGPSDMTHMGDMVNNPNSPVSKLLGGMPKEKPELARTASPLSFVSKDSAPTLIMHGDKDNLVPLKQSTRLADALKAAGVDVHLEVIKDNGHGGPGFNTPEARKMIEDFFDKHLKAKGE